MPTDCALLIFPCGATAWPLHNMECWATSRPLMSNEASEILQNQKPWQVSFNCTWCREEKLVDELQIYSSLISTCNHVLSFCQQLLLLPPFHPHNNPMKSTRLGENSQGHPLNLWMSKDLNPDLPKPSPALLTATPHWPSSATPTDAWVQFLPLAVDLPCNSLSSFMEL